MSTVLPFSPFVRGMVAILVCVLCLAGCSFRNGPRQPEPISATSESVLYTTAEWNTDAAQYEDAFATFLANPNEANKAAVTALRNRMANRLRADILSAHLEYESKVVRGMADWNIGADMAELAMAAAITITGGERAKTVMAAVLTAMEGSRHSIDKHWFREQTADVLVSSMRAARIAKDTEIVGKLSDLSVDKYDLDEAKTDLISLLYAGTLPEAFQRLAAETGARQQEAQEHAETVAQARATILTSTPEQVLATRDLFTKVLALSENQSVWALAQLTPPVTAPAGSARAELRKRVRAAVEKKLPSDPVWATWNARIDAAAAQPR